MSPEERSLDRQIITSGQLLVEGRVPEMFMREMITAYGLQDHVQVRTFGDVSKNNLQAYLGVFSKKATFREKVTRLGIIRDAESSTAESAFQSVQAALRDAELPVPNEMKTVSGNPIATGVFIFPDCQRPGMLEDLCLSAITDVETGSLTAVMPCVDEFFGCLEKRNLRPANSRKARFAGYALARDVIDPQLGRAAQMNAIPWEAQAFQLLKQFIERIANRDNIA